jgi:hypothetical protein
MASERLQRLRISRRCYRILNNASVLPENLKSFYRTYRLPDDPFFPLFLSVKKNWMEERLKWRQDRRKTIASMVARLPPERRRYMDALSRMEQHFHPAGKKPVWERHVYPATKKRAGELSRFSELEWQDLTAHYLQELSRRYTSVSTDVALLIEAKLVMGFDAASGPDVPEEPMIQERFRELSKKYHPDLGGESRLFRRLKTARDFLIENQRGER